MGIEMNLASMATDLKAAQLSMDVSTAVTEKVMDVAEVQADALLQMLAQATGVGTQINVTA